MSYTLNEHLEPTDCDPEQTLIGGLAFVEDGLGFSRAITYNGCRRFCPAPLAFFSLLRIVLMILISFQHPLTVGLRALMLREGRCTKKTGIRVRCLVHLRCTSKYRPRACLNHPPTYHKTASHHLPTKLMTRTSRSLAERLEVDLEALWVSGDPPGISSSADRANLDIVSGVGFGAGTSPGR